MNEREKFEAWAEGHYYLCEASADRDANDEYTDMDMQHAWESWQAAQPDPNVRYGDGFHDGYLKGREEGWDAAMAAQPAAPDWPTINAAIARHFANDPANACRAHAAIAEVFREKPAASAEPSDAELFRLYIETISGFSDGRGYEAGIVAYARALLSRYNRFTGEMSNDIAHEVWVASQLTPGYGIEDAIERIKTILSFNK